MFPELIECCQSSRSVARDHRVVSELTECFVCRDSRRDPVVRGAARRETDAVTAAGSGQKAANEHVSL